MALLFNGTNQQLVSDATIDLSGALTATFVAWLRFVAYDLINAENIFETSILSNSFQGTFGVYTRGDLTDNPLEIQARAGDGGSVSRARYNTGTIAWDDLGWHHLAMTIDIGRSSGEVQLYQDGVLLTADSRDDNNGTGNLGNRTFYVGARGTGQRHSNIEVADMGFFRPVLTTAEVNWIYRESSPRFGPLHLWRCWGNNDPVPSIASAVGLDLNNAPTKIDHPELWRPPLFPFGGTPVTAVSAITAAEIVATLLDPPPEPTPHPAMVGY